MSRKQDDFKFWLNWILLFEKYAAEYSVQNPYYRFYAISKLAVIHEKPNMSSAHSQNVQQFEAE